MTETLRTWLRREGDRELPAGPKGRRTREALLRAAAGLFAQQGYTDTAVWQIAERAGVSLGTFYIYFRDRADVVRALLHEYLSTLLERTEGGWRVRDGEPSLRRLIEAFVSAYAEQASFAGTWEELSHVDRELAAIRRELGRTFTQSVERELLRGSRSGRARRFTAREAALAARALTGMVDRFCYVTYVFDPPADVPSPAEAAELLTQLWSSAVELS